jgi:hypothetical protein
LPTTSLIIGLAAGAGTTILAAGTIYWPGRLVRGRRHLAKVGVLLAATVALLNVGVESAWADWASADADVYRATYECAHAHVYINNTAGQPHLDAYGMAETTLIENGVWYGCTSGGEYLGPYQIRTREDLYVYSGGWKACNYGPFIYNTRITYIVGTGWNSYYPCGRNTYYFDSGYGGLQNGGWLGGWTQVPHAVYVGN